VQQRWNRLQYKGGLEGTFKLWSTFKEETGAVLVYGLSSLRKETDFGDDETKCVGDFLGSAILYGV
jgi:hypothetical protein